MIRIKLLSTIRAVSGEVIAEFNVISDVRAKKHRIWSHIDSTWWMGVKQTHF
ncbi:MAG: hypothetical protein IJ205_04390 [Bacteroidales bacterium]|nr:hypothetical protein [Bacteroidales bacterium]